MARSWLAGLLLVVWSLEASTAIAHVTEAGPALQDHTDGSLSTQLLNHRALQSDNGLASEADTDESEELGDFSSHKVSVVFITAVQLIGLFYAFQNGITGWEPLWVLGIEGTNYCLSILQPGLGDLETHDGRTISWLRYAGWMVTCPVLLMFLTAMTTYGGRPAPVRLVPLLIANQMMILAGVTACAYGGIAKWVIYLLSCACGGIVITLSIICLLSLWELASLDREFRWGRLRHALKHEAPDASNADGAAAKHLYTSRCEAARKLIGNHMVVLRDITRPDGPPASQPNLTRMPGWEREVDSALFEIARRLIGRRCRAPTTPKQATTWAATAKYLAARLQVSTAEVARVPGHQHRKPDMGPAAGAAMRAVLLEIAEEKPGTGHFASIERMIYHFGGERFWSKAAIMCLSTCFLIGWFIFPVAWTLGPPGVGYVSLESEERMYAVGDVLAKNCFACFGVFIKHNYLRYLNPDREAQSAPPAGGAETAVAGPPVRPRIDRRPSQIIFNETISPPSLSGPSLAVTAPEETSTHQVELSQMSPSLLTTPNSPSTNKMSSETTEALLQHAILALEPLCGRLCTASGLAGSLQRVQLDQARALCDAVLRLTDAGDEDKVVGETMATHDAMSQSPLFTQQMSPSQLLVQKAGETRAPAKGWAQRCRAGQYSSLSNSPTASATGSPSGSATASPPGSPQAEPAQGVAPVEGGNVLNQKGYRMMNSPSSPSLGREGPKEFEPTMPPTHALMRARQQRHRKQQAVTTTSMQRAASAGRITTMKEKEQDMAREQESDKDSDKEIDK